MSKRPATLGIVLTVLGVAISLATPARSESAEEFFKGKQIALIIGYNPGGTYDIYSRLAATLLPKYIPGHPRIVPQNMPGVGSAKAGDYLFNQAPRDGLTIGVIGQQLVLSQALGDVSVKFDISKFNWLGRFTSGGEVTAIWHTSPTKTLADAMKRETPLAATSAGSASDSFPLLMNRLAGTNFKIIKGYSGTNGTILAMERGETEGAHATVEQLLFNRRDWLRDKKPRFWSNTQWSATQRFRRAGDERIRNDAAGQAGARLVRGHRRYRPRDDDAARIPADRLAVLRKAFDTMLKDPAFQQELEQRNLEFGPMSGAEVQKRVAAMLSVSSEVVTHAIASSR
jgi:tripartite-type tricarboxylate transporter receptor subunit TctC